MKKTTSLKFACIGFLIFTLVHVLPFTTSEVFAQKKTVDVVYFVDGSSFAGTILDMNRNFIRIKDEDDRIFEFPTKNIYKFSSARPFREIYRKSIEANR